MNEIAPESDGLGITLRLGKSSDKTGMGRKRIFGANKTAPLKRVSEKNLRGREEKVLKAMIVLIVQEIHNATGKSMASLEAMDLDHITGRNATGYEPLGAILDPLNLQLLERKIHSEKTNALTREAQRFDFRSTLEQEIFTSIRRRILEKVGRVFSLDELDKAINGMIYHEVSGCLICNGQTDK